MAGTHGWRLSDTDKAKIMNTLLAIAFIFLGFSLLMSLLTYLPYWRSGEEIPRYLHGGTASSLGVFFILVSVSMDFEGGVAIVCFILGAIFSIASAVIGSRALRQVRSRRQ